MVPVGHACEPSTGGRILRHPSAGGHVAHTGHTPRAWAGRPPAMAKRAGRGPLPAGRSGSPSQGGGGLTVGELMEALAQSPRDAEAIVTCPFDGGWSWTSGTVSAVAVVARPRAGPWSSRRRRNPEWSAPRPPTSRKPWTSRAGAWGQGRSDGPADPSRAGGPLPPPAQAPALPEPPRTPRTAAAPRLRHRRRSPLTAALSGLRGRMPGLTPPPAFGQVPGLPPIGLSSPERSLGPHRAGQRLAGIDAEPGSIDGCETRRVEHQPDHQEHDHGTEHRLEGRTKIGAEGIRDWPLVSQYRCWRKHPHQRSSATSRPSA